MNGYIGIEVYRSTDEYDLVVEGDSDVLTKEYWTQNSEVESRVCKSMITSGWTYVEGYR